MHVFYLANKSKSFYLRVIFLPVPIIYRVHRLRDGKSFGTRRVDAIQKGNVIFSLLASFQVICFLLDLELDKIVRCVELYM